MYVTDCSTGVRRVLWEKPAPIQDSERMFNWVTSQINLNYVSPEMRGIIAPTDTRFRGDQRLYE